MFSLTIFLGHGMWQLLYKTKEKANETFTVLMGAPPVFNLPENAVLSLAQHGGITEEPVQAIPTYSPAAHILIDDFGSRVLIAPGSLHGAVLENMAETALGACERALHQQRTTVKAQAMAMADPALKQARYSQGPAVIDPTMRPMGNGQFRG